MLSIHEKTKLFLMSGREVSLLQKRIGSPGYSLAADQYVNGYWRDTNHDGIKDTYVDGYHKTTPNNSTYDNYNTKGNTNPRTGKEGTVNPQPYNYQSPSYNPYSSPYGGSNR
jgi:hypothetical protein